MNSIYSLRNRKVLENRKVFVGYLPVGFPNNEKFIEIIREMQVLDLDIFELGYPASNPYADGKVIKSALKSVDYSMAKSLKYWRKIREAVTAPIWIMGYFNDLIVSNDYIELSKAGVVDAFVIPDMSLEEYQRIQNELKGYNVDLVNFVKNDCKNLADDVRNSSIIYYQLVDGVTGTKTHNIQPSMQNLLATSNISERPYVLGGFGIDSGVKAKSIINLGFDGTIVGTELLKRLIVSEEELYYFVKEVKNIVNKDI